MAQQVTTLPGTTGSAPSGDTFSGSMSESEIALSERRGQLFSS